MAPQKTKEKREAFLQAYSVNGFIISDACKTAGINRSTYRRWMKIPAFAEKVYEVKEEINDLVEHKLLVAAKGGNVTAMSKWLESHAKDRGYTPRQEVTGAGGGPIITITKPIDRFLSSDFVPEERTRAPGSGESEGPEDKTASEDVPGEDLEDGSDD